MKNKLENKRAEIEEIIESIKKTFPFKGYIETASDFGKEVALLIENYLSPGTKILDFGCGPCDKTAIYKRMGYVCYACDDLNDDWHKENNNRERIKEFARKEGVIFSEIADSKVPYEGEIFDGILVLDVIEHLHNSPRSLLNVLISTLKTGGYLFVGMPNAVNIRKRISVLFGRTNYPSLESFYFSQEPWRGHVREYTLQETKQLLIYQGLAIVYAQGATIFAHNKIKNKYIRGVYKRLTQLLPALSEGILVIGKKPKGWQPSFYNREKDLRHVRRPKFTVND